MLHSVSTKEPKGYRWTVHFTCGALYSVDHLIILRGKQSFILTKCVIWVGGEMQHVPRTAMSARVPGDNNIQHSRYPTIYKPAFSSIHLKGATYHLWKYPGNSHSNDVFEFCGYIRPPTCTPPKAGWELRCSISNFFFMSQIYEIWESHLSVLSTNFCICKIPKRGWWFLRCLITQRISGEWAGRYHSERWFILMTYSGVLNLHSLKFLCIFLYWGIPPQIQKERKEVSYNLV